MMKKWLIFLLMLPSIALGTEVTTKRADLYTNYSDVANADEFLFWRASAGNLGNISGLSMLEWIKSIQSTSLNDYGTPAAPGPRSEFIYMTEATGGVVKNATLPQMASSLIGGGYVTPQMYTASGTDDTAIIEAAIASGSPIDWGNATYTHSGIDVTVAHMNWKASGAKFVYSGPQIQNAFKVTLGLSQSHTLTGEVTFDGGGDAHVAGRFASAALVDTPYASLPSLTIKNIVGRNAYRASTAFVDGDALSIDGGFQKVDIDGVIARDSYMAVGAEVFGAQGIFGLSFRSLNSRWAQHITINNYHMENIWSEDAAYTSDQDGIRIFQDMDDPGATCTITNGVSRNVSGRTIKLHSAPNAIIDGLHIERRSTVIPQQGLYGVPDIDCQQAPAIVKNISFVYDGAWKSAVVQNWTERGYYRYGGGVTDGIKGVMLNASGNTLNLVILTSILAAEPADQDTESHANISNISVTGAVANAVYFRAKGNGKNTLGLVNIVGNFTEGAVEFNGDDTAEAVVLAANVVNVGAAVPFNNTLSGEWDVNCVNCYGFTGVTQLTSLGGQLSGWIAGNEYLSVTSDKRMGIGDAAASPYRALHVAQNLPHVRLSDMDATTATEVLAYTEIYRGLDDELVSLSGFPSASSPDLETRNYATGGDIVHRVNGTDERLRLLSAGGSEATGPVTIVASGTASPDSNGLILRAAEDEYGTAIVFYKHPTSDASTNRIAQITGHGNATGSLVDEMAFYTTMADGSFDNKFKVLANTDTSPFILTGATGVSRSSGNPIKIGEDVLGGGTSKVEFMDRVGIGVSSTTARLHVYQNDTEVGVNAGVLIEQEGAGDAVLQFSLTGAQRWVIGADNSADNEFAIASTTDLASSKRFRITTDGVVIAPIGFSSGGPIGNKSYTVATLPDPADYEGHTIYVSDGAGGPGIAVSDGVAWLRTSFDGDARAFGFNAGIGTANGNRDAILAAIAAADGASVIVDAAQDFDMSLVTVTDTPVNLLFRGAGRVKRLTGTEAVLTITQNYSDIQAISAMTSEVITIDGTTTAIVTKLVVADETAYSRGDVVRVVSDDIDLAAQKSDRRLGESSVVADTDTGIIYLAGELEDLGMYLTSPRVAKMSGLPVNIEGLKIASNYTFTNQLISVRGAQKPKIGFEVSDHGWIALNLIGCYHGEIRASGSGKGDSSTSLGYLVNDSAGEGNVLNRPYGKFWRHLSTTNNEITTAGSTEIHKFGATRHHTVLYGVAESSQGAAFDEHEGSRYTVWYGCEAKNHIRNSSTAGSGFQVRGHNSRIVQGFVDNTHLYGLMIGVAATGEVVMEGGVYNTNVLGTTEDTGIRSVSLNNVTAVRKNIGTYVLNVSYPCDVFVNGGSYSYSAAPTDYTEVLRVIPGSRWFLNNTEFILNGDATGTPINARAIYFASGSGIAEVYGKIKFRLQDNITMAATVKSENNDAVAALKILWLEGTQPTISSGTMASFKYAVQDLVTPASSAHNYADLDDYIKNGAGL